MAPSVAAPSNIPTNTPTDSPSISPTSAPIFNPNVDPTIYPTFDPEIDPTMAPSAAPSNIPINTTTELSSTSPTFNPTYIKGFEYGVCLNLQHHIKVLYHISQFECINICKSMSICRMVNYYKYLKTFNDSRCYIFEDICKLSYNKFNNPSSTLWFKGILNKENDKCNDYPLYWKDIV
eukprot:75944_1